MATTAKGKPLPDGGTLAEHGTRTLYMYGCRCEPCRAVEANYRRGLRERRKAALVAQGYPTDTRARKAS